MERTAPHVTRWPAKILGFSDRDMPDAAHGVSACVTADAGTYGLHRHAHGTGYREARIMVNGKNVSMFASYPQSAAWELAHTFIVLLHQSLFFVPEEFGTNSRAPPFKARAFTPSWNPREAKA